MSMNNAIKEVKQYRINDQIKRELEELGVSNGDDIFTKILKKPDGRTEHIIYKKIGSFYIDNN